MTAVEQARSASKEIEQSILTAVAHTGLSPAEKGRLRDEFAMHALTGLITNPNWHVDFELTAKQAYEISDAMMKAREVSNG